MASTEKFLVHCPGMGPDTVHTKRETAAREIAALEDEGYTAYLRPILVKKPTNFWAPVTS
jgi:hypothetical protein